MESSNKYKQRKHPQLRNGIIMLHFHTLKSTTKRFVEGIMHVKGPTLEDNLYFYKMFVPKVILVCVYT